MFLRSGACGGQLLVQLAALLLETLARRCELAVAGDSGRASCPALLDGRHERLLLRGEIRDGVIERRGTLPRLLELRTAPAELRLRVGELILPARGFRLRLRARVLEPLELIARIGQRFGDFFAAARGRLCALAQAIDLVTARDDSDLRIVAAIHAQPMAPDPHAFARDERLAVGKLVAPRDRLLRRGRG